MALNPTIITHVQCFFFITRANGNLQLVDGIQICVATTSKLNPKFENVGLDNAMALLEKQTQHPR
jgi:hypothetical protein